MQKYLVASKEEVVEGKCKIVKVKNTEFGLYRVNGQYYAWKNACPHFGAPVCRGVITGTRLPSLVYEYEYGRENEIVRCPWHGWEFDLMTGEHLVDPNTKLFKGKLDHNTEDEGLEKGELEEDDKDLYIWL
ncbi:Rieske (2Fe-2S) protein [Paenibacillus nasutitermitis]|uniref:Rieske domain-containing protein n=1 Tax=Paenibacillus nasutitermitis TaxID=1652958 RepID=A0A917DMX4_9BACL|nr:Rieske 2Fe-2S domain-containing protein [Paenibacillus nasutitermitis]GGD52222.1 hypothetical protein GCM10010911_07150 [Paenibacillus nasutitermitis]